MNNENKKSADDNEYTRKDYMYFKSKEIVNSIMNIVCEFNGASLEDKVNDDIYNDIIVLATIVFGMAISLCMSQNLSPLIQQRPKIINIFSLLINSNDISFHNRIRSRFI